MATLTPLLGRSKTPSRKIAPPVAAKAKGKGNGNIMSFFKKAPSSASATGAGKEEDKDEGLFIEGSPVKKDVEIPLQTPTPPRDGTTPEDIEMKTAESPLSRYNEDATPNKRRRREGSASPTRESVLESSNGPTQRGPFVDDSDSDDLDAETPARPGERSSDRREIAANNMSKETLSSDANSPIEDPPTITVPPFEREATSLGDGDGFDGMEDFIDDEFPEEGEEFMERRWMEEQAELELGLEEDEGLGGAEEVVKPEELVEAGSVTPLQECEPTPCPVCSGSTIGMTEQVSHPH